MSVTAKLTVYRDYIETNPATPTSELGEVIAEVRAKYRKINFDAGDTEATLDGTINNITLIQQGGLLPGSPLPGSAPRYGGELTLEKDTWYHLLIEGETIDGETKTSKPFYINTSDSESRYSIIRKVYDDYETNTRLSDGRRLRLYPDSTAEFNKWYEGARRVSDDTEFTEGSTAASLRDYLKIPASNVYFEGKTNDQGEIMFKNLPNGTYTLEYENESGAWVSVSGSITISDADNTSGSLYLKV